MNRLAKKNLVQSLLLGAAVATLAGTVAYAEDVETVVVTGSLIPRASMTDTPIPTVMLNAEDIQKSGQVNIGAVIAQLPQIQLSAGAGDLTPTDSNFLTRGFGEWNADLRNLGPDRTLVLVNGQRWVTGSPTVSTVDLNTIPTEMIERVDVATGGTSAAYGSDAVAGVINFILKDDFEGLQASARYGKTTYGDGGDQYYSALMGGNFMDGRGNVTIDASYEKQQKIGSGNRDLTQTDAAHFPGLFGCYGTVDCFLLPNAYSSYTPEGRFEFAGPFGANDQTVAFSGPYSDQGCTKATDYMGCTGDYGPFADGYDRNPERYIQVPLIRRLVTENGHFDIAPWLRFNLTSSFAYTSAKSQLEPYPGSSEDGLSKPISAGGTGILIPLDNPFVPASLLAQTDPDTGELWTNEGATGLFFYRRFIDSGARDSSVDRYMARVAAGFQGNFRDVVDKDSILNDWTWNANFVWGHTSESQFSYNYYDKIKMQNALNTAVATPEEIAAGSPFVTVNNTNYVCADPVAQAAGCVPIDLFGAYMITPQAAKYVGSLVTLQNSAQEQVLNFQATGSLLALPAGNAKLAFGGEYRREAAAFVPDAATQAGTVAGNAQPAVIGHFSVHEIYAEGVVPVVKDLPFAEYVELDGSVRAAKYSTAGKATSWKYGGIWQVNDDIKLRGSESSATRAPNINELYSPPTQTFPGISSDLCSNPAPGSNIAINCATQIAALGSFLPGEPQPGNPNYLSYAGATGLAAKQGVGGYDSGNSNLVPETAYTFTVGFAYTPTWLSNFQATMDYYDIRVHDYIGTLDPQTTQQACYEAAPSLFATNIFCQQITRQHDPNLGPIIKQINFPDFNLGSIKTAGVDMTINYNLDLGALDPTLADAGTLAFALNATYVGYFNTNPGIPGTEIIRTGGDAGLEKWRGTLKTTYTNGPSSTMLTLRYIGPADVSRESALGTGQDGDLPGNRIPSIWYADLYSSYDINDQWQLFAGANNLFNTQPPETFIGDFDNTGTGTISTTYDTIGLFIYGGVNLKM